MQGRFKSEIILKYKENYYYCIIKNNSIKNNLIIQFNNIIILYYNIIILFIMLNIFLYIHINYNINLINGKTIKHIKEFLHFIK